MADTSIFRSLSAKDRAIVAIGVLLDGHDAASLLSYDNDYGATLSRAAEELTQMPPDLRVPFAGTALRRALSELS